MAPPSRLPTRAYASPGPPQPSPELSPPRTLRLPTVSSAVPVASKEGKAGIKSLFQTLAGRKPKLSPVEEKRGNGTAGPGGERKMVPKYEVGSVGPSGTAPGAVKPPVEQAVGTTKHLSIDTANVDAPLRGPKHLLRSASLASRPTTPLSSLPSSSSIAESPVSSMVSTSTNRFSADFSRPPFSPSLSQLRSPTSGTGLRARQQLRTSMNNSRPSSALSTNSMGSQAPAYAPTRPAIAPVSGSTHLATTMEEDSPIHVGSFQEDLPSLARPHSSTSLGLKDDLAYRRLSINAAAATAPTALPSSNNASPSGSVGNRLVRTSSSRDVGRGKAVGRVSSSVSLLEAYLHPSPERPSPNLRNGSSSPISSHPPPAYESRALTPIANGHGRSMSASPGARATSPAVASPTSTYRSPLTTSPPPQRPYDEFQPQGLVPRPYEPRSPPSRREVSISSHRDSTQMQSVEPQQYTAKARVSGGTNESWWNRGSIMGDSNLHHDTREDALTPTAATFAAASTISALRSALITSPGSFKRSSTSSTHDTTLTESTRADEHNAAILTLTGVTGTRPLKSAFDTSVSSFASTPTNSPRATRASLAELSNAMQSSSTTSSLADPPEVSEVRKSDEITPRTAKRWSIVEVEAAYERMRSMLGTSSSARSLAEAEGRIGGSVDLAAVEMPAAFEQLLMAATTDSLLEESEPLVTEDTLIPASAPVLKNPFRPSSTTTLAVVKEVHTPTMSPSTVTSPQMSPLIPPPRATVSPVHQRSHDSFFQSSAIPSTFGPHRTAPIDLDDEEDVFTTNDLLSLHRRESDAPSYVSHSIFNDDPDESTQVKREALETISDEGWTNSFTTATGGDHSPPSRRTSVSTATRVLRNGTSKEWPRETMRPWRNDEGSDGESTSREGGTSLDFEGRVKRWGASNSSGSTATSRYDGGEGEVARRRKPSLKDRAGETWFPATPDRRAHRRLGTPPRLSVRNSRTPGDEGAGALDISSIRGMDKLEIFFRYASMKADLDKAELERDALLDALQESRAALDDVRGQRDFIESELRDERASSRQLKKLLEADTAAPGERTADLLASLQSWEARARDAMDDLVGSREEVDRLRRAAKNSNEREGKLERELVLAGSKLATMEARLDLNSTTGGAGRRGIVPTRVSTSASAPKLSPTTSRTQSSNPPSSSTSRLPSRSIPSPSPSSTSSTAHFSQRTTTAVYPGSNYTSQPAALSPSLVPKRTFDSRRIPSSSSSATSNGR